MPDGLPVELDATDLAVTAALSEIAALSLEVGGLSDYVERIKGDCDLRDLAIAVACVQRVASRLSEAGQ